MIDADQASALYSAEILVTEDVWGSAFEPLRRTFTIARIPRAVSASEIRGAAVQVLVVRNATRVDEALLDALPRLRVVARAGTGLDNIDVAAADERGVAVISAHGANATAVAELTIGLAVALLRRIPQHDRAIRTGQWLRTTGGEILGRTWGVVGLGATGKAVARLAACLGASVIGHDPHVKGLNGDLKLRWLSLEEMLAESDIVSLHMPSTTQTRGIVNDEFLRHMRSGALLINVGRGELVDEGALIEALESGRLGGAALDVRAVEPPLPGRLEQLDNVISTPHIGGMTCEAAERIAKMLVDDIRRLLTGSEAQHVVGRIRRLPVTPRGSQ